MSYRRISRDSVVARRTQRTQVVDVERELLITAMRNDVVDDRGDGDSVLLLAEHTERMGLKDSSPQAVTSAPSAVVVDCRAVAVALLLVGAAV